MIQMNLKDDLAKKKNIYIHTKYNNTNYCNGEKKKKKKKKKRKKMYIYHLH